MTKPRFAEKNRAQVLLGGMLLILFVFLILLGVESLLSGSRQPSIQGEPRKDPATGLYTVYVLVTGHRDLTILHRNLHANIHIDFISCYYTNPPDPPTGWSLLDFSKPIHVVVTVKSLSPTTNLLNTFDTTVSLGAPWGRTLTYNLPSGTYTVEAQGTDQDGYQSLAKTELILP